MPPTQRGRFVWYDLMTTDPSAAIDFYRDVIGWTTQEWHGPTPYTMFHHDGTPVGGVMTLPEEARSQGAPPHWLCYIGTADIQQTVQQARALGAGVYVEPTDIPNVGRFAVLSDPQRAAFAVFQGEQAADGADPQVGDASWHEFATADYNAAFPFYEQLFGWNRTGDVEMAPGAMYQMFGQGDRMYGGMYNFTPEMPPIAYWMPYFRVADLDASLDRVRGLGGQVMVGPMEVPGGDHIGVCLDPQGAVFGMHHRV